MDVECYRIILKPDSITTVRKWAERMKAESAEVKKLLHAEGIILESVFLEEQPEGSSLIYYLRATDLQKAREVSRSSQHPLDLYHQEVMKQVAANGTQLECLFDVADPE